jgi:hypothetical protein
MFDGMWKSDVMAKGHNMTPISATTRISQFNVTEHGGRVDVGLIMTVSFQSSRVRFLNGSSDSFRPFYSRRPLANRKIEYAEVTSVISPTPKLPLSNYFIFDFRDQKELRLLAFPYDAISGFSSFNLWKVYSSCLADR